MKNPVKGKRNQINITTHSTKKKKQSAINITWDLVVSSEHTEEETKTRNLVVPREY